MLTIGRLFGAEVRVSWGFPLTALVLIAPFLMTGRASAALGGLVFLIALVISILAHEIGHALMARVFGVPTLAIEFNALGGLARFAFAPQTWARQALVSFAGPAVNLAIAAAIYSALRFGDMPTSGALHGILRVAMLINAALFAFNLLPAFPLDGGRILNALLTPAIGERVAIMTTAIIGLIICAPMIVAAYTQSMWFALFVGFVIAGENQRLFRAARAAA